MLTMLVGALTNEPGSFISELGVEAMKSLGGMRVAVSREAVVDIRSACLVVGGWDEVAAPCDNHLDVRGLLGLDHGTLNSNKGHVTLIRLRGALASSKVTVLLNEGVKGLSEPEAIADASNPPAISSKDVCMMPGKVVPKSCPKFNVLKKLTKGDASNANGIIVPSSGPVELKLQDVSVQVLDQKWLLLNNVLDDGAEVGEV